LERAYFFDLDGTVIRTELLPAIAKDLGIYDEMLALTMATMAGEIPFDQSFKHRVSMLSKIPTNRVAEIVLAQPVCDVLLQWICERSTKCWIVTGNLDCWVRPWLDRYGLNGFTSVAEIENGEVKVARILRKADVLSGFKNRYSVFVGDGANDAEAMRKADVSVACSITHPAARVLHEIADFSVSSESSLCRLLSRL
jgi:phosphoserine phosphatase